MAQSSQVEIVFSAYRNTIGFTLEMSLLIGEAVVMSATKNPPPEAVSTWPEGEICSSEPTAAYSATYQLIASRRH